MVPQMSKKILYIRNFAEEVDITGYNLQEIGLGKALVERSYDVDIVYYTRNKKEEETIYSKNGHRLKIIWSKGFKFLSNSIYFWIFRKKNLKMYHAIITTEYNQIMTLLLTYNMHSKSKLLLYHGPYKDNENTFIQRIYDMLFTEKSKKKFAAVFTKSKYGEDYLLKKGFKDVKTIGVGLDTSKFEKTEYKIDKKIKNVSFDNKKVFLYIGRLEDRRNIYFLLNLFKKVNLEDKNSILLLIGSGEKEESYFNYAKKLNIHNNIVHVKKVKQKNLAEIYKKADVFLFPSTYDIFGMVLLESLYFGVPIISSKNGGSTTLIKNGVNGFIVDSFKTENWLSVINKLIERKSLREFIKENGYKTIKNNSWYNITEFIEKAIEKGR